jgi:apolipoprotein D and lipocalin family protein
MLLSLFQCSTKNSSLKTVPSVDLSRYSGKWYEIASFPQSFQKGCHNTSAVYTLSPKGYVIVENRCNKGSINGKESYIKGKAFVVENSNNAKLKVQFFWPFKGDYWIVDLAEDYSYAAVGSPDKNYLWILARSNSMESMTYGNILNRLTNLGFDVTRLSKTVHTQ